MKVRLMLLLVATLFGLAKMSTPCFSQRAPGVKPAFSMVLSTRQTVVEVGSPLVVRLAISNTSEHDVCAIAHSCAPIEMSVLDSEGNPVPETPFGKEIHGKVWPSALVNGLALTGSVTAENPISIRAGETVKDRPRDLAKEYDLSKPGTYTIRARRYDPSSKTEVVSNSLTITLTPASGRPKTSFTLTVIAEEDTVTAGGDISLLTEATNTSGREIVYDTSYLKDDVQVRDAEGNLAALTPSGRKYRVRLGTPGSLHNLQRLQPGCSIHGTVAAVQEFYDMSRPGDYTIQVSHFDEETKTWVKSNALTVTVTP